MSRLFNRKLIAFGILSVIFLGMFAIPTYSVSAAPDEPNLDMMDGCIYFPEVRGPDVFPSINLKACISIGINGLLWLMSWLVGFGASLMDIAINETVINMADRVDEIDAITAGWEILRDMANLTFIFILLYIAIQTILGLNSQSTYQALAYTIVIGILMNFSLFFTQVIIDTSNVIAVKFYENIQGSDSIATQLLASVELPTVYGTPDDDNNGPTWGTIATTGLGGVVLFIIVAFSFLAAAILLILRFVVLVFLMILSPLAFAAYIIPKTRGYFMMWLQRLLKECFWVPIYFVMLYIAMGIAATLHDITSTVPLNEAMADPVGGGTTLLNFFVIIFFFVAALLVSQKVGATGASTAMSIGSKWGKSARGKATAFAGGATLGAAGFAGRQSLGRVGARIAESETLKGRQAKGGVWGLGARGVRGAGSKVAKSSFDVRATSAGGGVAGALGLGKAGGKGGFEKSREEYSKKQEKIAESLAPSKAAEAEAKAEVERTTQEAQNAQQELDKTAEQIQQEFDTAYANATPGDERLTLIAERDKKITRDGQLREDYKQERQKLYDDTREAAQKAREIKDKMVGVDLKTMKERVTSDQEVLDALELTAEQVNNMGQKQLQENLNSPRLDGVRKEKGLKFYKPAKQYRAEQYADQIEQKASKTGFRAGVQRLVTLKSKRDRLVAGAAIRKSVAKKSSGDQLLDVIKKAPEFKETQEALEEKENTTEGANQTNPQQT